MVLINKRSICVKRIISIVILFAFNIFVFTGCTHDSNYIPPDEMARLQSVSVMEYIKNEDIDGLKNMFCNKVSSSHDLDKEISDAISFMQSKILSYDPPKGTVGSKEIKSGETIKMKFYCTAENIKTDKDSTYSLTFTSYAVCEEDPSKVGITYLRIIKENDEFYQIGEIVR